MQYLHELLAFLAIPFAVNGVTRITTPNYKAVNFAKEISGMKLNGSVIKELEVVTEGFCRLECVDEVQCLSYNFGPSENKNRLKCQLSDSDRFSGVNDFTEEEGFSYRGIQVNFTFTQSVLIRCPYFAFIAMKT